MVRRRFVAALCVPLALSHASSAADNVLAPAELLKTKTSPATEAGEATKVSGSACTPDEKTCVLVGDEYRYALTFKIEEGVLVLGSRVFLLPKRGPDDVKFKEADVEGISYADGYFYFVGSHGRSRSGEKQASRYFVYRVRADALAGVADVGTEDKVAASMERSSVLEELLVGDSRFETANKLSPEEGGTNIEGLAVVAGKVYVGFRGPLADDRSALIGETSVDRLFGSASGTLEPHPLKLEGGQVIRDLAVKNGEIFILSGPQDRKGGRALVYSWSPGHDPVKQVELGPPGSSDRQPETLMVMSPTNDAFRGLVFDDGDVSLPPRIFDIPVTH
jgi:hypothetical protein